MKEILSRVLKKKKKTYNEKRKVKNIIQHTNEKRKSKEYHSTHKNPKAKTHLQKHGLNPSFSISREPTLENTIIQYGKRNQGFRQKSTQIYGEMSFKPGKYGLVVAIHVSSPSLPLLKPKPPPKKNNPAKNPRPRDSHLKRISNLYCKSYNKSISKTNSIKKQKNLIGLVGTQIVVCTPKRKKKLRRIAMNL